MPIKIIKGNILHSNCKYIAHQCNCVTNYAAGVAKAIFDRFPWSDIYSERTNSIKDMLGNIIVCGDGKEKRFVINMISQLYPGKPKFPNGKEDGSEARENYFKQSLNKIKDIKNIESIAFPYKIGCGNAGGNWEKYFEIIQEFSWDIDCFGEVFIYDND